MQRDAVLKSIRKHLGNGKKGALLFLDIVKAFDNVSRVKIRDKCAEIDPIFCFFAQMPWGMRVKLSGCDHEWIWVDKGTGQGLETAAPLFNIAMNDFPTYAIGEQGMERVRFYADDTVAIVRNTGELKCLWGRAQAWADRWDLEFNLLPGKTNAITMGIPENEFQKLNIPTVEKYRYLGVDIKANKGTINVNTNKTLQNCVIERLGKLKKATPLIIGMLNTRNMSIGSIKGYIESLQRGILYGSCNLYANPTLAKYVYKDIDTWTRKIIKIISGVSRSSPSETIERIWALLSAEELHNSIYFEHASQYYQGLSGGDKFCQSIREESNFQKYGKELINKLDKDLHDQIDQGATYGDAIKKRREVIKKKILGNFCKENDLRNANQRRKILAALNNTHLEKPYDKKWWQYKTRDEICLSHNCLRDKEHLACS